MPCEFEREGSDFWISSSHSDGNCEQIREKINASEIISWRQTLIYMCWEQIFPPRFGYFPFDLHSANVSRLSSGSRLINHCIYRAWGNKRPQNCVSSMIPRRIDFRFLSIITTYPSIFLHLSSSPSTSSNQRCSDCGHIRRDAQPHTITSTTHPNTK